MPSTITAYYTFTAGTKARSSQVNVNFSNYRGDLLPINEDTITASDSTHDLGSTDHRWDVSYVNSVNLKSSTTTAGLVIKGDTTNTTGAFLFQINGSTTAMIPGLVGSAIDASALQWFAVTITATGVWTVPAGVTNLMVYLLGGGGGGCGGQSGGSITGGSGGQGAYPLISPLTVASLDVLSITIGVGGSGGAANVSGASGSSSQVFKSGVSLLRALGAKGGIGQTGTADTFPFFIYMGGAGATANLTGTAGMNPSDTWQGPEMRGTGGAGGSPAGIGSGGGGGGGAGSYGNGGAGGPSAIVGQPATATAGGIGAGGGGGGGSGTGGTGGQGGPGLAVIYYIKR